MQKCQHTHYSLYELNLVFKQSYINNDSFDYGLDDNKEDLNSLDQLPAPEIIESWHLKADLYPYNDFSVQSLAEGAILIKSKAVNIEPDL